MRIGTAVGTVTLGFALVACGGDSGSPETESTPTPSVSEPATQEASSEAPDETAALRAAAQAYSDAFLTGEGETAYALLSSRCRDREDAETFAMMASVASEQYGEAIPFSTFEAEISGDLARVTYTYEQVPAINQDSEPWVREGGDWKQDDC